MQLQMAMYVYVCVCTYQDLKKTTSKTKILGMVVS